MNRVLFVILIAACAAPAPPRDLYGVVVNMEPGHGPIEAETAEKVKRDLLRLRPENPGRDRSFHAMRTPDGIALERTGWTIQVRRAAPTKNGWRALVYVSPQLCTVESHRVFATCNYHIEGYAFENGKLRLVSDMIDPLCDPADGLGGIMFGGALYR